MERFMNNLKDVCRLKMLKKDMPWRWMTDLIWLAGEGLGFIERMHDKNETKTKTKHIKKANISSLLTSIYFGSN